MTAVYVGLALLMITLVTLLVLNLEKRTEARPPRGRPTPRPAPPPTPRSAPRKRPKVVRARGTRTNPFGMKDPEGAMILSRAVLVDLPLPPPPVAPNVDDNPFAEDLDTLVAARAHREAEAVIELEVDD